MYGFTLEFGVIAKIEGVTGLLRKECKLTLAKWFSSFRLLVLLTKCWGCKVNYKKRIDK